MLSDRLTGRETRAATCYEEHAHARARPRAWEHTRSYNTRHNPANSDTKYESEAVWKRDMLFKAGMLVEPFKRYSLVK